MTEQVRTQLRLEAELYEKVREQAYRKRQSRNQFMAEGIRDKVSKEETA